MGKFIDFVLIKTYVFARVSTILEMGLQRGENMAPLPNGRGA